MRIQVYKVPESEGGERVLVTEYESDFVPRRHDILRVFDGVNLRWKEYQVIGVTLMIDHQEGFQNRAVCRVTFLTDSLQHEEEQNFKRRLWG